MKLHYLEQPKKIPLAYIPRSKNERDFMLMEDFEIELSDGRWITIPKGYITDLSSKPKWIWSILPPFDKRLIGTIIHDWLWTDKVNEIRYHGTIVEAFEFSNTEFDSWNRGLAKEKKTRNNIEYWYLKNFSFDYYIGKKKV